METVKEIILFPMLEYQKSNNIKGQCITNVQFLYDRITKNSKHINPKARAVICFYNDHDIKASIFIVHMVIIINDEVVDPSFEIYSKEGVKYFDNWSTLEYNIKIPDNLKHGLLSNLLKFIKLSDEINNGGLIITDKDFYNKQADYIEAQRKPSAKSQYIT